MLKKCSYERTSSLSAGKTLLCIQEHGFLTVDNIINCRKGMEKAEKKMRTKNWLL